MVSRRRFLIASGIAGAGVLAPWTGLRRAWAQPVGNVLEPAAIPKFQTPLVVPPPMPQAPVSLRAAVDYYEIAVRQFRQQILPPPLPMTTIWSYGAVADPGTFNYPAFTVEARHGRPVRVKWINGLVDASGRYLPHLLPVDPTLHWANPAGGSRGRDSTPGFLGTPSPYQGPVPFVTHLHGGRSSEESDGYAEAWYLPQARDIPPGYATTGSFYQTFRTKAQAQLGHAWAPGSAVFQYQNDQDAATLWYHDHTLGMTRLNVYAGPAGFYLLRGGPRDLPAGILPGPAPAPGDAPGTRYFEIPIAIQDRAFKDDGSGALFYPDSRAYFDGFDGPYRPFSDVAPIWNPEFFGNVIVVNGRSWPYLEVEPRRYRLRLLNGCNARFLILAFTGAALPIWQIGTDGGFLPAPVALDWLLLAPAERADVIVDFSSVPVGTQLLLRNFGPDEPFGGGLPGEDFEPADPASTGLVMQFRVVAATGPDTSTPPEALVLPAFLPLGPESVTRQVALYEEESTFPGFEGPVAAMLGTLDGPLMWADGVTESPLVGTTEVWEIHNFTVDAHPVHIHEVQFEVVDRQPFDDVTYPPEPGERGFKDTVIAYPGEITRVKARFEHAGRYVWHCHVVEHEDNEMMRPYIIRPAPRR